MKPIEVAPINALILAGGASNRLGRDKTRIQWYGQPHQQYLFQLCQERLLLPTYLSVKKPIDAIKEKCISDTCSDIGPMAGLLSAFQKYPNSAFLCIASDMPFIMERNIKHLIEHRQSEKLATVYRNTKTEKLQPLFAIWEPQSYKFLRAAQKAENYSLYKVLLESEINVIDSSDFEIEFNVNTAEDYQEATQIIQGLP